MEGIFECLRVYYFRYFIFELISSENIPTALKLINEVLLNANVPILLKFQEEIEDAPDVFDVEDKNPSQENNSNMKGKSKSALKRFRKKLSRLSGPSAIETINNILFPDSSSFSNELKQDNLAGKIFFLKISL